MPVTSINLIADDLNFDSGLAATVVYAIVFIDLVAGGEGFEPPHQSSWCFDGPGFHFGRLCIAGRGGQFQGKAGRTARKAGRPPAATARASGTAVAKTPRWARMTAASTPTPTKKAGRRATSRSSPPTATARASGTDFGETVSDEQMQQFVDSLWKRQREYEDEFLARSDRQYAQDSYDNLVGVLSRVTGRLDAAQKTPLREALYLR
mgnify:CR=1 FL=1